jgi:sugar phosphate isomerase/epimerase
MPSLSAAVITDEFSQDFEKVCGTASELGISGLEIRTAWDQNVVDMSDEKIEEIQDLARQFNLRIVAIASPVYKCTLPEGGEIDERFEQDAFHAKHSFDDQERILGRALEIARVLNARIVRVFSFWRTVEPARVTPRIVEALRHAAERGQAAGIKIGLENEHACNIATAAEAAPVLQAIAGPNLGLVWDPANAYVAGEAPYPNGYRLLPVQRILHVHAKDGVMPPGSDRMNWGEVGGGAIDWKGQLAALVEDGYRGAVSLETHWGGPAGNKFEGSKICARNLLRLIGEAG